MKDLIKVSRYRPEGWLPHGLRIKVSELKKLDDHLYSFYIEHPSRKYLEFSWASCYENGAHYEKFEMIDPGEKDYDDVTSEDYISGAAKGAALKITYTKPVTDIIFKVIPLKWETQVFMIVGLDNDIWGNWTWRKK